MTALIFALIKENYVSEQGARMVSMDGASKNAADMIDKLTLSFNRMRQAVSTRPQIPGHFRATFWAIQRTIKYY